MTVHQLIARLMFLAQQLRGEADRWPRRSVQRAALIRASINASNASRETRWRAMFNEGDPTIYGTARMVEAIELMSQSGVARGMSTLESWAGAR